MGSVIGGAIDAEADSDTESIFSSHAYSALSEGSDDEHSCISEAPSTSLNAFERLKGLLQRRDKQLVGDQQPTQAPVAETAEKALAKVRGTVQAMIVHTSNSL